MKIFHDSFHVYLGMTDWYVIKDFPNKHSSVFSYYITTLILQEYAVVEIFTKKNRICRNENSEQKLNLHKRFTDDKLYVNK